MAIAQARLRPHGAWRALTFPPRAGCSTSTGRPGVSTLKPGKVHHHPTPNNLVLVPSFLRSLVPCLRQSLTKVFPLIPKHFPPQFPLPVISLFFATLTVCGENPALKGHNKRQNRKQISYRFSNRENGQDRPAGHILSTNEHENLASKSRVPNSELPTRRQYMRFAQSFLLNRLE
jgi:hypothetical protein